MKARVTFTDSDGDSGTVDEQGYWNPEALHRQDALYDIMRFAALAATQHQLTYDATVTKIEIEIIG